MNEKTLNIYEKMLAITSELTRVAKNLQVGEGRFAYKAVGEADILAAVRPLEEKNKVYSYPVKREIIETGELETTNGKKNLFLRVEVTYRFINVENPSEYLEIVSYGDGVDSQDKAPGKAMTYADKYALMKAYKIMTGDDPDQNASEELGNKKTTPNKPNSARSKQTQTNTRGQQENAETGEILTPEQANFIRSLPQNIQDWACNQFNAGSILYLTKKQAQFVIDAYNKKKGAQQ